MTPDGREPGLPPRGVIVGTSSSFVRPRVTSIS
jgi:hypothetical protein